MSQAYYFVKYLLVNLKHGRDLHPMSDTTLAVLGGDGSIERWQKNLTLLGVDATLEAFARQQGRPAPSSSEAPVLFQTYHAMQVECIEHRSGSDDDLYVPTHINA